MPTRDDISALIQRRLSEQKLELGPDDELLTSGVIDSIGMMRLIGDLERDIGRNIPPADLVPENFHTPRVMANYLAGLVKAG
jgi:acyl carrier protein